MASLPDNPLHNLLNPALHRPDYLPHQQPPPRPGHLRHRSIPTTTSHSQIQQPTQPDEPQLHTHALHLKSATHPQLLLGDIDTHSDQYRQYSHSERTVVQAKY